MPSFAGDKNLVAVLLWLCASQGMEKTNPVVDQTSARMSYLLLLVWAERKIMQGMLEKLAQKIAPLSYFTIQLLTC